MKTHFHILLIGLLSFQAHAEPSLFDNIKAQFELGTIPKMEKYSSKESKITSGRCVDSSWPHHLMPAYFISNHLENDPFVKFSAYLEYTNRFADHYFDSVNSDSHLKFTSKRVPLIQQSDQKTYLFELETRNLVELRESQGILIGKISLFQRDENVFCYFHLSVVNEMGRR